MAEVHDDGIFLFGDSRERIVALCEEAAAGGAPLARAAEARGGRREGRISRSVWRHLAVTGEEVAEGARAHCEGGAAPADMHITIEMQRGRRAGRRRRAVARTRSQRTRASK